MKLTRNQSFALGNALGLAILVTGILITAPAKMKEQEEIDARNLQEVVVCTQPIESGSPLSSTNVKAARVERAKVPLNSIESLNKALQMVARRSIKVGSTISYEDVVPGAREEFLSKDRK